MINGDGDALLKEKSEGTGEFYSVTPHEGSTRGLSAEVAVEKYFDLPHDFKAHPGGDGGVDKIIHGHKTQIKSASFCDHPLYLKTNKDNQYEFSAGEKRVDRIILVFMPPDQIKHWQICGWCTPKTFIAHSKPDGFGYGQKWVLDEVHLSPMDEWADGGVESPDDETPIF